MFKANDFRDTIVNFINYWDTYIGLTLIYLIFFAGYYGFCANLLNITFPKHELIINLITPLVLCVLILCVWSFKSNRWNLYNRRTVTTGLFIKCDDFGSQSKMRRILREMKDDIQAEFPDLRLKIYPVNFFKNENQLKSYLDKSQHIIDNALFAIIQNGNCTEESRTYEKIEIIDLKFVGLFDDENYSNYRVQVNVSQDLQLRNLNKDWVYLESKSFYDKDKIKYNLKDSLLFFMGLYLVYKQELDIALQIFKSLKRVEDKILLEDEVSSRKRERLDEILLNIFTVNAIRKYSLNNETETAFKLLKECEVIFKVNHKFFYANCILLARIYYEKGEIPQAYEYTEKAAMLFRDSTPIYCNTGFFGMIENNEDMVYQNYRELAHVYKHKGKVNFVDVIEFLEKHKNKYPKSKILFDFCIAMLNFLYVDKEVGRKNLNILKESIINESRFSKIYVLTDHILSLGSFKSPYHQRTIKTKSSKKSKKRK